MICENQNIISDHKRGDSWGGLSIVIESSEVINGVEIFTPVNLTGFTVVSRFRTSPSGVTVFEFKTFDDTLKIPNPISGELIFQPRKMDVPVAKYFFDVQLTAPNGDVETICNSAWNILQDIS
jgi:hypothetical protein